MTPLCCCRRIEQLKLEVDELLAKAEQAVEPVFGIIESAMGFRQFLLRGLTKVSTEWTLVCLAYNFRRLHTRNLAKNVLATA